MTAPAVRATARQSLGNYLSSIAGNYLYLALAFAVRVYLTRTLGPEGIGRLTLVFAMAQTAAMFAGVWAHAPFLRHGAEELARAGTRDGRGGLQSPRTLCPGSDPGAERSAGVSGAGACGVRESSRSSRLASGRVTAGDPSGRR